MSSESPKVTLCTNIVRYERLLELSKAQAQAAVSVQEHIVSELAKKFEGQLVEKVGGRIMATFKHPDSAMASAVSLLKAIDEEPFYVRIGLHFGDTKGSGQSLSGAGVIIASELAELASPDHIVISAALKNELSSLPHVKVIAAGERFLPGVSSPVNTYRVEIV